MDEDTVVICHNADVPVRSITADLTRPAMMVWNKIIDDNGPEWGIFNWTRKPPPGDLSGDEDGDQAEEDRKEVKYRDGDKDEDREDVDWEEYDEPQCCIW